MNNRADERAWGLRINLTKRYGARDCPTWARHWGRENWDKRGVILWDHQAQQITWLRANQALQILDDLRTYEDWREHGITVGEPVTRLSLDDPEQKPQVVLTNKMHLDPAQTQELFDLLQSNEDQLLQMAEADEEERRQALARAYRYLLNLAARRRQEGEGA